ncbi:MAG: 3-oxoacyl-ACP reductase [Hylemonella sp.]|uniref:3-oxoacyl-ACP reductase n=1 Tax=Hylemonella sp. TaxID=2066020 RepID=UPI0022C0417F|nr:3-oxoacyl-ACP reductase [Hylemonella sp.]MCZ8250967.1 3-oxoacyl-ACP reductase [Hylemonella sp.]
MTDRLLQLANTPWSAPLVRLLGLPQPRPLPRKTAAYTRQELAGRRVLLSALDDTASSDLHTWLQSRGAELNSADGLDLVLLDLRSLGHPAQLGELRARLQAAVPRLSPGARVLVLAPAQASHAQAAAAAAAVEGVVRSLAKEIGRRGATANLLQVPAELDASALAPLVDFLGTARSAYVSGQVLRLQAAPPVTLTFPALQGHTALVTGAAGGIGAATARRLAADGAHVICVDMQAADVPLQRVANEINGQALALDITAPDAPARLVAAAQARGGLDVLVHNAGITRDRTLGRMSASEWDSVLAVNLQSILAIDAALDAAHALRPGVREVCLASISGIAGNAGQTNYAASKAGLIGYVRARATQLQTSGGTINAVAPGFIETAMTQKMPLMVREAGRRLNALKQGGQPEDVAEAIAFLARPDAVAVNGQVLRVCGQSLLGA